MQAGELIARDQAELTEDHVRFAWSVMDQVMDPEVPVVSLTDLGIVREITPVGGHLKVVLTPTYSGCPATEHIEQSAKQALEDSGFNSVIVEQRLAPAWTTDWITERGRLRLKEYGIAPPIGSASKPQLDHAIPCPLCDSTNTKEITEFGSTACKALYQCTDCLEPFDYFKCI